MPISGSGVIDWSTNSFESFVSGTATFTIDPNLILSSADYNGGYVTFIRDRQSLCAVPR